MKNMKRIAFLAMVGTLAFSSTGCKAVPVSTIDEKLDDTIFESIWDLIKEVLHIQIEEEVVETIEHVDEPEEEDNNLTADELREFQEHFNEEEYNGLLATDYHSPQEIDWSEVTYSGGVGGFVDSDTDEYEAFCEFSGYDFKKPIICISKAELEEYVRTNTGTEYDDAIKPLKEAFLEEFDSYAFYHVDSLYRKYEFTEGSKDGDTYTLTYKSTGETEDEEDERILPKQVTLKKVDNQYQVVSNLTLWEADSNPSHTGPVKLTQCEGDCKLVEYYPAEGSANRGVELKIIENDLLFAELPDYTYASSDEKYWTEISEVEFFDYSGDNKSDAVIIGKRDGKDYIGIYLYSGNDFDMKKALSSKVVANAKENSDWSMEGVKKFLLEGKEELSFADYKEAYAHVARLAELTGDDYRFELAYINEDDEPELVQCSPSKLLNIYTFKDGHVENLLYDYLIFDSCILTEYVEKENLVVLTNYSERFEKYENEYLCLKQDAEYEIYYKEWTDETADSPSYSSRYKEDVSRADDRVASQEYIDELDQKIYQDFQFNMSAQDVYKALK